MISVAVCYRASYLGIPFFASKRAAAMLIGAALMVLGYDVVVDRMDDFTAGLSEQLDAKSGRRNIWEATLKAIPAYWPLGAGVGSLQQVYPMHVETHDVWQFYTHAENGPLQVTLETGVAGLALTILAILLCAFWCVACLRGATSKRTLVCGGAVSAALGGGSALLLADDHRQGASGAKACGTFPEETVHGLLARPDGRVQQNPVKTGADIFQPVLAEDATVDIVAREQLLDNRQALGVGLLLESVAQRVRRVELAATVHHHHRNLASTFV